MTYSGFWRRFGALCIDGFILWIVYMILMIVPFFPQVLWIIISTYYHVAFETSPLRATPGKALLGIAVIKPDGRKLTIKDSIIRNLMSFISSALLCAGYFMALFTDKNQTLHDIVADTIVVKEKFAENDFWQIFVAQSKIIFATDKHSDIHVEKKFDGQSLEELYNLYQKGILTEEEYNKKKEEYLSRI